MSNHIKLTPTERLTFSSAKWVPLLNTQYVPSYTIRYPHIHIALDTHERWILKTLSIHKKLHDVLDDPRVSWSLTDTMSNGDIRMYLIIDTDPNSQWRPIRSFERKTFSDFISTLKDDKRNTNLNNFIASSLYNGEQPTLLLEGFFSKIGRICEDKDGNAYSKKKLKKHELQPFFIFRRLVELMDHTKIFLTLGKRNTIRRLYDYALDILRIDLSTNMRLRLTQTLAQENVIYTTDNGKSLVFKKPHGTDDYAKMICGGYVEIMGKKRQITPDDLIHVDEYILSNKFTIGGIEVYNTVSSTRRAFIGVTFRICEMDEDKMRLWCSTNEFKVKCNPCNESVNVTWFTIAGLVSIHSVGNLEELDYERILDEACTPLRTFVHWESKRIVVFPGPVVGRKEDLVRYLRDGVPLGVVDWECRKFAEELLSESSE